MLRRTLVAVALVATTAAAADAQDVADYAAYFALLVTPQGAFAPLAPASGSGAGLGLRYGRIESGGDALNNFAVTARFAGGPGVGSMTAGILTCGGCDQTISLGAEFDVPLVQGGDETARFGIGLRPAVGFAFTTGSGEGTAMSASIGAPLSLSAGTSFRVTPFVVPGFGFGRMSGGGASESGLRPMIGFGVGLENATRTLGGTIGMQKTILRGGDEVLGLNVVVKL